MTPAAASSPYAEPPARRMASTCSTRCAGSSRASSRVPVARPTTCTPHRKAALIPRTTVHPVAPTTSVAWPTASPQPANELIEGSAMLLEPLGRRDLVLRAGATLHHAANIADDANEGTALHAGISLGRALLVATGAADHRVVLFQLRHVSSSRPIALALDRSPSPNSRIFLMSVAREMPSSRAARVRFAECARSVRSM